MTLIGFLYFMREQRMKLVPEISAEHKEARYKNQVSGDLYLPP